MGKVSQGQPSILEHLVLKETLGVTLIPPELAYELYMIGVIARPNCYLRYPELTEVGPLPNTAAGAAIPVPAKPSGL